MNPRMPIYPTDPPELQPCPFCGSRGNLLPGLSWQQAYVPRTGIYRVWCPDCRMEGPPSDTSADAIRLWNERAAEAAKAAE